MKQSLKKEKLSGSKGFDSYYSSLFESRWQGLRQSLLQDVRYTELNLGGEKPYYLDGASVCAALCLDTEDALCIADLCAAPGGKTLVIASCMKEKSLLYSNERSPARKKRLDAVVEETLCKKQASLIHTSCSDASLWGRREKKSPLQASGANAFPEQFDAILLDAPCSSERHVLGDKKYLDLWSPARIRGLSSEQWALLSSAWRILKDGGSLVYATCALNMEENDGVVCRLKKKFSDATFLSPDQTQRIFSSNLEKIMPFIKMPDESFSLKDIFSSAEVTDFGLHILPDTSFGCGPLYFSCIKKCRD